MDDSSLTKFEVGETYATRSIGDHECIYSFKIIRRTAKSVWIPSTKAMGPDKGGLTERRGLSSYNGVESFSPFGTYSFSPTITADKTLEKVTAPRERPKESFIAPREKEPSNIIPFILPN